MNGARHPKVTNPSSTSTPNLSPSTSDLRPFTSTLDLEPSTSTSTSTSDLGPRTAVLPHHRLHAYSAALDLLGAVRAAVIRDATLRDQALRSAKSACLNVAEAAARGTRPDQARVFTIARAEACEAAAAVEIAAAAGDAAPGAEAEVNRRAARLVALLNGLIR